MTAGNAAVAGPAGQPGPDELRLITVDQRLTLAGHLARYGPAAAAGPALIAELDQSGLTGKGGAAFPAGRKLRAVAEAAARAGKGRGRPVIVANGSESEPASSKDSVLLNLAPHLVLDGIDACAGAIGASRAFVCVTPAAPAAGPSVQDAVAERRTAGVSRVPVEVMVTTGSYLSGQETALISTLNGGRALPGLVPPWPASKGVQRRPTLVLNVETLAQVALIARYGSAWFRSAGTADAPGSTLVTVGGAVDRPGVREIPLGTPLGEVLRRSGLTRPAQAVLAGGYFGSWLPLPDALQLPVSEPGLRAAGAALGPGVLTVLPDTACGLAETARVTGYLAGQSAGQCGPCRNGMPALAEAMNWIAFGQPGADVLGWALHLTGLVSGRGACHLPDGAATLVASALTTFAADVRRHAQAGPCQGTARPAVLPIPPPSSR